MTPYADFLYFGVLLYILVPTLLLGLVGRLSRPWILVATAGMMVVQYWSPLAAWPRGTLREIFVVAWYALFEWVVADSFLWVRKRSTSRRPFYAAVGLALLPLLAVKVLPIVAPAYLLGFAGISYVTFRSLDVIFSIQDKLIATLAPDQYLAFMLFFPTISSGPVDRYRRFALDWKRDRTRGEFLQDLDGAVHRVFTGFLYKFILASLINTYWMEPASKGNGILDIVSYTYAYTFYLFFDFAGYSNFATGFSYLLGIHTPDNFNRPFLATNLKDFWNRWHISLSFWFRDFVYMRFVLAATKGRWFKGRYTASRVGYLVSMGLMGMWHGLTWYYVVYGLYQGVMLAVYDVLGRWNKGRKVWRDGLVWKAAAMLICFHVWWIGMLLFSGRLAR